MGINVRAFVYVGAVVDLEEFFTKEERPDNCECIVTEHNHKYCPDCGHLQGTVDIIRTTKFGVLFYLADDEELDEDDWSDLAVNDGLDLHCLERSDEDDAPWFLGVKLAVVDSGLQGWNADADDAVFSLNAVLTAFSQAEELFEKYDLKSRDPEMRFTTCVS